MFQAKVVEKIKIHFMFSNSCTKVPSVRYGTARQATDDNITWRFASWVTKATDTHTQNM